LGFNSLTENSVLGVGDKLLIVAPSPTSTETPEVTATSLATATAVPVTVARITSTPLPHVVTLAKQSVATPTAVTPNNSTEPLGFGLETTTIVIGALLLGIGTIAILVLKKQI